MFASLFGGGSARRKGPGGPPAQAPQLTLIAVSPDFLALHNAGKAPARRVRVHPELSTVRIVNRVDAPFDLAVGQSWTFLIEGLGRWTDSGYQLSVTWEGQDEPVCIPLPTGAM